MQNISILIIEDDPDGRASVSEAAEDAGFRVALATTGLDGVEQCLREPPDVVLSDFVLPDIDGLEVLARIKAVVPSVPVLIMTAYASLETGVKAMRLGAYDYITKPLDLDDIQAKLRRAAETAGLRRQVTDLARTVRDRYSSAGMVAVSGAMRGVLDKVAALADTQATVLLRGESGVGKELVARALHVDSSRAEGPFIAVNCGAIAESLLESELFGHEKGAFTGAVGQYKGAFERADGGTLFLDEVGDAPASVQVKLLRALEEKEIRRVGGRDVFTVRVRVVSATNQDLDAMVEDGKFRQDLLYRLNVVTLEIPPLRQRVADIRPLADLFLARACREHGRTLIAVRPDFYTALEGYSWPGNVRQLRNIVESAVLLTAGGVLDAVSTGLVAAAPVAETGDGLLRIPEHLTLEQTERQILETVLKRNQGNRTLTAEQLGLSRRTIQRKIQEHGLPY